jgi:hypothetical protein
MSEPSGPRAWLTVLFGLLFVVTLTVWLFGSGTVERVSGFAAVAAGVGLVVVAVRSAFVERAPGCVLVGAALAGVGALLTAVVFGFAYLETSWTYVRGEHTRATAVTCDDAECESTWELGGRERSGEVELAFGTAEGDTLPVRAHGDEAVREGGLTVLVVASSGVALVSPLLVAGAVLVARRQTRVRHQPSGGGTSSTSSA